MPTFIRLTEPSKIHYHVKLHQNPKTRACRNTKIAIMVKFQGHHLSAKSVHSP